jgi:type VI secretion system protein ImpK
MGYRGRYALGDSGELHQMLRQSRDKIERIRGAARLTPPVAAPEVRPARAKDSWSRALLITACVLGVLVIMAFAAFELSLGSGVSHIQNTSLTATAQ